MAAQFLKTTPILRMFDVRKAREFYLDFLGFKVDFEHRFEPSLPLYMRDPSNPLNGDNPTITDLSLHR